MLDYLDMNEPDQVVAYHHELAQNSMDDEAVAIHYRHFVQALALYPEDSVSEPWRPAALYERFADSEDVRDRQTITTCIAKLWDVAPDSALRITQKLWLDVDGQLYKQLRRAAATAVDQGLLSREAWGELRQVVPFFSWRRSS